MQPYTLKFPIERDGADPITTLSVRRPRLRDIEAFNKAMRAAGGSMENLAALARATDAASLAAATGEAPAPELPGVDPGAQLAAAVAMLASMNGLDPDVLMDLDPEDFSDLQVLIAGFQQAVRPATREA